ncbi:MAG: diguanylate cyclase [Gammaproteobacteria bacterium]|nr:diguanylate cyclase [Gammaproteobacteria bacterium]NNF59719.1 diguanylate cyclase [Gammaproteobacteria bacterium]
MCANRNICRLSLAAAAGLLFASWLDAAPAAAATDTTMRFQRYSIDDGLSQSNVQAIVQDHSGLLWFATENGLNRFNGYDFSVYRRDRSSDTALENDFIADLAVDESGNVWVATDGGGIARWNAVTDGFEVLQHVPFDPTTIADDNIRAVLAAPGGVVWVGTRGSGLNRIDTATGAVTHYSHDPGNPGSLSSDEIYALALDASGALWIATQNGLNRLEQQAGAVTRYLHDPGDPASLADSIVESLYVDAAGTVWAGTFKGGLSRLDAETGTFVHHRHNATDPASLSNDRVQVLYEDTGRRFWVGTAAGLNLMNREAGTFTRYGHDPADDTSLSGDNIMSLFQDASGVLWVGTKLNGINAWNPRSWSFGHHAADAGLSSPLISAFAENGRGELWIGTFGGGLNVLDRSTGAMRHIRAADSDLGDDRIMALLIDSDGTVWAGTMGGGLNRIDTATGEIRTLLHEPGNGNSLPADGIMSLFEDSAGYIWAGTFGGGASRFDKAAKAFTNFAPEPGNDSSLSAARATAITEDQFGIVWVGTDGGGLNALDGTSGRWQHFRHDPDNPASLSANTVYSLHVDKQNRVWVGTRAGLDRLQRDPETGAPTGFSSITQNDGLANDTIYGVRSDRGGNIWISTNYGLARLDPRSGDIRNFHRIHGLQGEEFNFGAHHANEHGELFFGGTNGFNVFNPAELELGSKAPGVILTSFSKLNQPFDAAMPIEKLPRVSLDYDENMVTFEFAATDFVSPAQNHYRHMLEGFDRDWVNAGTERRITYTNLDPGNYVLRVKAANSDGVWSEPGIEIPVSVAPAPWQTWWAYLLYALVVAGAIVMLVRVQQRKLAREAEYSRRLESEVNDRTQELAERNEQLQVANSRLHEASHTDALTGLRNRRYLFDEITRDIDLVHRHFDKEAKGRRSTFNDDIVFIVVDLDNFKPVNDILGHQAGDRLLLTVCEALVNACRSSDIVIRWGGDEFLVVARETSRVEATQLVERIRANVENCAVELDNGQVARTTCSLGFAAYPFLTDQPDLLDWQQILWVADVAMYRAKAGRNAWCGIYGSEWTGTAKELLEQLKLDAEGLAENRQVRIVDATTQGAERIA